MTRTEDARHAIRITATAPVVLNLVAGLLTLRTIVNSLRRIFRMSNGTALQPVERAAQSTGETARAALEQRGDQNCTCVMCGAPLPSGQEHGFCSERCEREAWCWAGDDPEA